MMYFLCVSYYTPFSLSLTQGTSTQNTIDGRTNEMVQRRRLCKSMSSMQQLRIILFDFSHSSFSIVGL